MRRPNVILIVTDDQGYYDVGCNGNPYINTPNLDDLYNQAIHCEDYHTDPMCAPTRAGILTGNYSMRVGVWSTLNGRYYLNKESKTMADYFKEAGYATGLFGKWHMGDNYPYRAKDRGFDRVVSFGGGVVGETPDYWNNDYFDDSYEKDGKLTKYQGYCTDVWFDETIEFIKENRDTPFFCYLPTNAPHDPYNIDPSYKEPYLNQGLSDRISGFYGMITNVDENIGRLQEALKNEGLLEDTIIVFMGDNGSSGVVTDGSGWVTEGYNGNMRGKKGQVYEGSHKNSCFIRWDNGNLGKSRSIYGLTSQIDLLPTLLDCCDIPNNKEDFDGISMYGDLVKGETHINKDRELVIHFMQLDYPEKYKDFTVLTDQYRFIKTLDDGVDSMMIFDMKNDYCQKRNILEENTPMISQAMKIYDDWWDDVTQNGQNDYSYISIGHDEEEVKLTCHSWHGNKSMAYSQVNIRQGIKGSGYWTLNCESDGMYEVELRRWPKELDIPLNSSVSPIPKNERTHERPNGKGYEIRKAMLSVDGQQLIKEVSEDETGVKFIVKIRKGKVRLQTWFICEDNECLGAYYVYINKK